MTGKGSGKRGRPLGFKLSEESKIAISMSKTGQRHSKSTKDKISRSLILYFRRLNPLSKELLGYYSKRSEENSQWEDGMKWVDSVKDEIDLSEGVLTLRDLRNRFRMEDGSSRDIDSFGHNVTPELLLLFKEYCENNNIKIEDIF